MLRDGAGNAGWSESIISVVPGSMGAPGGFQAGEGSVAQALL